LKPVVTAKLKTHKMHWQMMHHTTLYSAMKLIVIVLLKLASNKEENKGIDNRGKK